MDAGVFTFLVAALGWRDGFEPVAASVIGFLFVPLAPTPGTPVSLSASVAEATRRACGAVLSVAIGGAIVSVIAFLVVRAVWPDDATTLAASKLGAIPSPDPVAVIWNFSLMRGGCSHLAGSCAPPTLSQHEALHRGHDLDARPRGSEHPAA